jgi:RIO-like serine/threonine protein kinase
MKFSIHEVKELKTIDISVIAMDEEKANEICEKIIKTVEGYFSKKWKYECLGQFSAEDLQSSYHYTITFEISSKKIDKTFDGPTEEESEKTKKFCELYLKKIEPIFRYYE